MLVADDYKAECFSQSPAIPLLSFITLLHGFGVPIQWPKLRGGQDFDWTGFNILLRSLELGISEKRAAWIMKWFAKLETAGEAQMAELLEGAGR